MSIARLQREAAARGQDVDDASVTTYLRFGFRLEWLPEVVAAFNMPVEVETDGGHFFTGEELVLLLLARYRSTSTLQSTDGILTVLKKSDAFNDAASDICIAVRLGRPFSAVGGSP